MKRVVLLDNLKESEIRPDGVYKEYKEMLEKELREHFPDPSALEKVNCPGCSSGSFEDHCEKMGLKYCQCNQCATVFINPRPTQDALNAFYRGSGSARYLRDRLSGKTSESENRKDKVYSYRIQWIMGLMQEHLPEAKIFVDYGTRYPMFLKELQEEEIFSTIIALFPECYEQQNLIPSNIEIIEKELEDNSVDILALSEEIERVFDPVKLIEKAHRILKPGGICAMTTTSSSGFEYQVLKDKSPNLVPTDRMNLFSFESLIQRLTDQGFEVVEASTPGRLDVEFIKKAYEQDSTLEMEPFLKYLFKHRSKDALHSLQDYLQQYQLSSHVRIAAIKK